MPPNRRTQCRTNTAVQASAASTAGGPCHGRGPAHKAAAVRSATQAMMVAAGWVPATFAPSVLPSAAGERAPAGDHDRNPAGAHRDRDRDGSQRRERQPLQSDHQHDRDHPERTGRSVPHHRERAGRRSVAAQPVGGVGQPVDMQPAGSGQQRSDREQSGQEAGRAEHHPAGPGHRGGQRTQHRPDQRQGGHGAAAQPPVADTGQHRSERQSRSQRTDHRSLRGETPAAEKVAMDVSAATAARSTGRTIAAPVPSPSRIRRSTIGSSSSRASASACAGSGER